MINSRFHSCPKTVFGVWGSLFNSATICPEVMERPFDKLMVMSLSKDRHQNQNALDSSPTEQGYLSTDPYLCLSSIPLVAAMGAVTSKDVLWVANLKRDPHTQLSVVKEGNLKFDMLWPLCKNNNLYE